MQAPESARRRASASGKPLPAWEQCDTRVPARVPRDEQEAGAHYALCCRFVVSATRIFLLVTVLFFILKLVPIMNRRRV